MRVLAALLVVLVLAGCFSSAEHPEAHDAATAETDGALAFLDTDGARQVVLPSSSNATVLFFMATWCPTCKEEAPMVASLHETYALQGVRFLSLDFDATETSAQLEEWKTRYGQPWPHGVDQGMRIQRALSATAASSVVVLDGAGETLGLWGHGRATEAAVSEAIDAALAA